MKQLQKDHTTPEQSKRLLELGVPVWTANIMFDKNRRMYELIETEDESWAETQRTLLYNGGAIPHWSACRLIEILSKCMPSEIYTPKFRTDDNILDTVLGDIERELDYGFDFSKLEE